MSLVSPTAPSLVLLVHYLQGFCLCISPVPPVSGPTVAHCRNPLAVDVVESILRRSLLDNQHLDRTSVYAADILGHTERLDKNAYEQALRKSPVTLLPVIPNVTIGLKQAYTIAGGRPVYNDVALISRAITLRGNTGLGKRCL